MKKTLLFALIFGLMPVSGMVQAQDVEVGANARVEARVRAMEEAKEKREQFLQNAEQRREEFKQKNEERREEFKEQNQERRAELKAEMQAKMEERRAEFKTEFRANVEARIEKWTGLMVKRFNAATERLEGLIVRIESRMEEMEANGQDTSEAAEFVVAAEANLEVAEDKIAQLSVDIEAALSQEELRGAFQNVHELVREIRAEIKSAHENLIKAVRSLKSIKASAEVETNATVESE